jgi:hypothetical protein
MFEVEEFDDGREGAEIGEERVFVFTSSNLVVNLGAKESDASIDSSLSLCFLLHLATVLYYLDDFIFEFLPSCE